MPQIEVKNLSKSFRISTRGNGMSGAVRGLFSRTHRIVKALEDVSFSMERGELVGYIGPNGAGKSTTVKILSGILVPDSGDCSIDGLVPWKDRIKHVGRIGVVFGQRTQLWWDLPVNESFDLLRDIYRIQANEYTRRRLELIELLGLEKLLDVPVRQLSLGQRMRCDIAASLIHGPSILFLDEPTIGLDAVAKLAVRDFIQHINRELKVTVILTTHDMDDIETLCRRVLVIGDGKILSDGSLDELRSRVSGERRLIIDIDGDPAEVNDPDVTVVSVDGHRVVLGYDPRKVTTDVLVGRIASKHTVRDIFVENPPIDEIIATFYNQLEKQ
ncbi:MAG: ATP-binding cassette domain-containing protein [Spirochaetales bacterium]|nr:ATP-binding cassette domain-containing protein [Spirochaetales bacterium]